jgi:copper(I)-binding protein
MIIFNRLFVLILTVILLTACGSGGTPIESTETGIEVHQVRTNATMQGENSELFMEMHNHGGETDQLTGVSSSLVEGAELHNGGEIVDVIPVYANTELEFTPDGYHVVLTGLKQELHAGDEFEVVLQFRDHDDITVKVTVGEVTEHEHEEGS